MPVSFLMPTLPHHYRRPWYARPQFYLPTLIVLLAIIFVAIYFGIVSSQLKAEAATYDLSKLEQMESASVIRTGTEKFSARSMSRTARPFTTINCHAMR